MASPYFRSLAMVFWIATSAIVVRGEPTSELRLQLFNVAIFGQSSDKAVKLLLSKRDGEVEPETVLVDIGEGRFYAATVRYPKNISLEQARSALNIVYKKWERKSFAKNSTMGIWRNEDDKFSVQLSQDDDNTVVIYIKYDSLPKRVEGIVENALKELINEATPEELEAASESLRSEE
ncbi:MAG: hypothetical protein H0T51_03240 [Pirellulales bacterium]|nr:hypothetical protein [Pirellulales bacterium]